MVWLLLGQWERKRWDGVVKKEKLVGPDTFGLAAGGSKV